MFTTELYVRGFVNSYVCHPHTRDTQIKFRYYFHNDNLKRYFHLVDRSCIFWVASIKLSTITHTMYSEVRTWILSKMPYICGMNSLIHCKNNDLAIYLRSMRKLRAWILIVRRESELHFRLSPLDVDTTKSEIKIERAKIPNNRIADVIAKRSVAQPWLANSNPIVSGWISARIELRRSPLTFRAGRF